MTRQPKTDAQVFDLTQTGIADKYLYYVAAFIFFLFYFPLLIPAYSFVYITDNLDIEIVMSALAGRYWAGEPVQHLMLNGNVPVWSLNRLTQPLIVLYAVFTPFWAYLLTDIIVRLVAFFGCFKLCRVFSCDFRLSVALAVLFSLSINYSVFVFSVAGLPLCLYLLIKDDRVVIRSLLMLFIGWNSSIYLSGGFFAVSAPVFLLFVLRKTIDRFVVLKLASYFAGLLLGNAGLIWLSLSTGTVWHRAEWKMHDLLNFEINPFWAGNPWFHVGPPMFFLFGVSILIFILTRSERLGRCLLLALLIPVFYLIVQSERTQLWIDGIGGFLRSLQFDRFYFLWPLIVIVSTVFAAQAKPGRARAWVFGAVAVQIVLVATTVPQWRLSLRKLFFEQPLKPFQEYYMENWFKASHLESSDVVMSVGVDPMLAPMNRVPSIDGYYSLYPLEYKHKFSEVIRNSLPPSGKANYFNKWGIEFMYFNRRVVPSLLISVRETGLEPNL